MQRSRSPFREEGRASFLEGSRMSREAHVRFCEGLGGRFPRPTRHRHHWTLDLVLEEDDRQPCLHSRTALEVTAWLRVLAYNLISSWRAALPLKDQLPLAWARACEVLRDALVHPLRSSPALQSRATAGRSNGGALPSQHLLSSGPAHAIADERL